MRWRKRIPALIIYIMFTVGVIGHSISHTLDLMVFLTPFFLLGMGIFVIHSDILGKNHKFLIFLIITYVITFSIEALGVETGLVFGDYVYGTTLGFHVIGVPLVIGFNWVLVEERIFGYGGWEHNAVDLYALLSPSDDMRLRFVVEDTGRGIPADEVQRVVEFGKRGSNRQGDHGWRLRSHQGTTW